MKALVATHELGSRDREILRRAADLLKEDGRIVLADFLGAAFEGMANPSARLHDFRKRVQQAGENTDIPLELMLDNFKKRDKGDRTLWFEGDVLQIVLSGEEKTGLPAESASYLKGHYENLVAQTGDLEKGKKTYKFFLSYAHEDDALRYRFLRGLQGKLKLNEKRSYAFWQDRDIVIGEDWQKQIHDALQECDYGILLLTPHAMKSDFIQRVEIPSLVEENKIIPLVLSKVTLEALKNIGLSRKQCGIAGDVSQHLYLDKAAEKTEDLVFQDYVNFIENRVTQDEKWVKNLVEQLKDLVEQLKEKQELEKDSPENLGKEKETHDILHKLAKLSPAWESRISASIAGTYGRGLYEAPRIKKFLFEDLDFQEESCDPDGGKSRAYALDELKNWAQEAADQKESKPLHILLGEYGTGKTFTSRMLAEELEENHASPQKRPAFYIDLRDSPSLVSRDKKSEFSLPYLEEVIAERLRLSESKDILPEAIIEQVRQGKLLMIFDGLDEKLVHYDRDKGQRFLRELMRILPREPEKIPNCRVLFTCRTHYFREHGDIFSFFGGQLREAPREIIRNEDEKKQAGDYLYHCMELQPFTLEQIRSYLEKRLSPAEGEEMEALLQEVHDLMDLARRPILLALICDLLPKLKEEKERHGSIDASLLYTRLEKLWYSRDDGKHQFMASHKGILLRDLAADFWRRGKRSWPVDELEKWLETWLVQHPGIHMHYQADKGIQLLQEDLRTATFLVRYGEENFRFAHTSIQEYLLASFLAQALVEGRVEDWQMPLASAEVLRFLGQTLGHLSEEDLEKALATLRTLRGTYRPQASENAFAYGIMAWSEKDSDFPGVPLCGSQLPGADLRDWKFMSTEENPERADFLNLAECDFSGANLSRSEWRGVDLSRASFREARLYEALMQRGIAEGADFSAAIPEGMLLRHMHMKGSKASSHPGCRLMHCSGTEHWHTRLPDHLLMDVCPTHPPFSKAAPCLNTGHSAPVTSCAFSPDGSQILSASGDTTLKLWNSNTGECARTFKGHSDSVFSCAFSPDGSQILSASGDKTLKLWNSNTGECARTFKGHSNPVRSCAFSPDGSQILSASEDNTLKLWNSNTGECARTFKGHSAWVRSCAFSPDGSQILSASDDKTLKLWNSNTGECARTFKGHSSPVCSCAFSPDGSQILSASEDNTLKLWNSNTGECARTFKGHSRPVSSCAFSPDGSQILSASWDSTLKLWDSNTGECARTFKGHSRPVSSCAFSPDGSQILSASWDSTLKLWDSNTGECARTFKGHSAWVRSCAFSPDGSQILSASDDNTLKLWNSNTGECARTFKGHSDWVRSCAFSPDGSQILSASEDNTLKLWNSNTGECARTFKGHSNSVFSCAFWPDGFQILSASWDKTLKLWNSNTGECARTFKGHSDWVSSCAFSPDGSQILSASRDKTLKLWNSNTGECARTFKGHSDWVSSCAFSPDGSQILSASGDKTLKLWNSNTGECARTFKGHSSPVFFCAFSPDGSQILSASWDSTLKLWNSNTGECARTFKGHSHWVSSCAFSPDGSQILSASWDKTLKLWNSNTGECTMTCAHLPSVQGLSQEASWTRENFTYASPDAWHFLRYRSVDPGHGIRLWNPEILGSIPGMEQRDAPVTG